MYTKKHNHVQNDQFSATFEIATVLKLYKDKISPGTAGAGEYVGTVRQGRAAIYSVWIRKTN